MVGRLYSSPSCGVMELLEFSGRNNLNCLNPVKVVYWSYKQQKVRHVPKSTSKPPCAIIIIETSKKQHTKDGTSRPVLRPPHPLPFGVARGQ